MTALILAAVNPSTKLASNWKGRPGKVPASPTGQGSVRAQSLPVAMGTQILAHSGHISVLATIGDYMDRIPGLPLPLPDFFLSKI